MEWRSGYDLKYGVHFGWIIDISKIDYQKMYKYIKIRGMAFLDYNKKTFDKRIFDETDWLFDYNPKENCIPIKRIFDIEDEELFLLHISEYSFDHTGDIMSDVKKYEDKKKKYEEYLEALNQNIVSPYLIPERRP